MKKYIIYLLLILSIAYLYANDVAINECKSDIYFANGIMTDEGNATKNLDLIWKKVLAEQYDSNLSKMEKELNFKTAYNETYGFSGDIYEAYLQLASESEGWRDLYLFISYVVGHTGDEKDWYNQALSLITGMNEEMIRQAYEADLSVQTTDYKNSIALGHSVIVVAHSQGNLFTNDAYKNITQDDGSWRKNYFTAVAVASPATKLFEDNNKDPHIGFENDPVAYLGTLGTTQNPNRSYKYRNALGELVENSFDVQFHSFDYYMGEDILFQDGIGERNISTDIGKVIIMNFLQEAIQNHRDDPSQWETDQEFDRNTCDYKITVKHRWDPSIEMAEKVYPFNASKKLYQAKDENGVLLYVKASCGGENIINKNETNGYILIDNPEEEKIKQLSTTLIYNTGGDLYISGYAGSQYYSGRYGWYVDGQNLFDGYFPPYSSSGTGNQNTCSEVLNLAKSQYEKAKQYAISSFYKDLEKLKFQFPNKFIDFQIEEYGDCGTDCIINPSVPQGGCEGWVWASARVYD